MGYMRDHAIVVSSNYGDTIDKAHAEAMAIFPEGRVSPILGPFTNDNRSFFVAPDGSKEGCETSRQNDDLRDQFIEWMAQAKYDDGSGPLNWVEVQFGDDDYQTCVTRDSDQHMRRPS